jgi:hypothetical protein
LIEVVILSVNFIVIGPSGSDFEFVAALKANGRVSAKERKSHLICRCVQKDLVQQLQSIVISI